MYVDGSKNNSKQHIERKKKTHRKNNERPKKPTGFAVDKTASFSPSGRGGVETQGKKSPRNGAVTEPDFQYVPNEISGLPSNYLDDGDSMVEWGGKSEVEVNEMPRENGSVLVSDNLPSGTNYLSNVNLGPASPATPSVKSVYDQAFQRWNHEYSPVQDLPLLWRIPRSASATFEAILSFW